MSEIKRKDEVEGAESPYVIEMCNITKEFPGIIANDDITLQLRRGEIHALLGENGAGKSTTIKLAKPVKQISFYVLFRNVAGKASFRNVFLYNK